MKWLLLLLLTLTSPAQAQNPTCPTRPVGDSSNACASTAFVAADVASVTRTRLTTTTAFFIRPSGSDTNCSGLANVDDPGTGTLPRACAFQTAATAATILCNNYDLNGKAVTVTALTGNTYAGNISLCPFLGFSPTLGYNQVTFDFTGSTINAASGRAIFASNNPTPFTFKNGTYANCSICVQGDSGGVVALQTPVFNAATGFFALSQYFSRIAFINGAPTISGNATVPWVSNNQGNLFIQPGNTVACTGNFTFLFWAQAQSAGTQNWASTTYSGCGSTTTTAGRCQVDTGGGITNSTNFPGSVATCAAGTVSPGWSN